MSAWAAWVFQWLYRLGFALLFGYSIGKYVDGGFWEMLEAGAFYVPAVGVLAIISGQLDLLKKNMEGGAVNIWARCLDFLHWFFLIFMGIGVWMLGGVSISWFLLKLVLIAVIAWQIGIGVMRHWRPTQNQITAGATAAVLSIILGIVACVVRVQDTSQFGWGWVLETSTSIFATGIVAWWIVTDLSTIKVKASDYPRSFFLKGIANNLLFVLFWINVLHLSIAKTGSPGGAVWLEAGLTFNTVVGNLLYLTYYAVYEYHRNKQQKTMERTQVSLGQYMP